MRAWITFTFVAAVVGPTLCDTYLAAYMDSHGPGAGEVYGAPAANYGAPATSYSYGPPMEEPHSAPVNPLDPIHAKIVLVFKVLLKLLIFKLIVKFIAIICVLFFLPKLSELGVAKEETRRITENKVVEDSDETLRVTRAVWEAISRGPPVPEVCRTYDSDSAMCGLLRGLRRLDKHYSIHRLLKEYLNEENFKLRRLHSHNS